VSICLAKEHLAHTQLYSDVFTHSWTRNCERNEEIHNG